MMKTAPPHDLRAMCVSCGTTLDDLSELTGISVDDLVSFSKGELGLSAHDWFAIIAVLDVAGDDRQPDEAPSRLLREVSLEALRALCKDCDDEELEKQVRH